VLGKAASVFAMSFATDGFFGDDEGFAHILVSRF
jgi:hypothetical protein